MRFVVLLAVAACSFVLRYTDELIAGLAGSDGAPACWRDLIKRVKTGYQLSLAKGGAYFVIEGELPPQEIMPCLNGATHQFVMEQQGDVYTVSSRLGTDR